MIQKRIVQARAFTLYVVFSVVISACSTVATQASDVDKPLQEGATSLHEKIKNYDKWFENHKLLPYGGVANIAFTDNTLAKVEQYSDMPDSALWTGAYLAAQAFRYAVTKDEIAKKNVEQSVSTLHLFLKANGYNGFISRFAGPLRPPYTNKANCDEDDSCHPAEYKEQPIFWYGNTSRDQYTGWFFGMALAYDLVEEESLRETIRQDIEEVVNQLIEDYFIIHHRKSKFHMASIVMPEQALAWLRIASYVTKNASQRHRYEKEFQKRLDSPFLKAKDIFDKLGFSKYADYYSFNLLMMNYFNLIRLEPDNEVKKKLLTVFNEDIYKFVKNTHNVFFEYLSFALGNTKPTPDFLNRLKQQLNQFPAAPNIKRKVFPQKTDISSFSISLYELNKKFQPDHMRFYPQASSAYSISQQCSKEFIWQRSPYRICCTEPDPKPKPKPLEKRWSPLQKDCSPPPKNKPTVYPGVDYMIAYWLGRYKNYILKED
ncbi:MAG: hypothetical protein GY862_13755 [Gammaproteobacteria bacterium]|nr:hypothetical protein [Gammaproteobacteria bacterium]